MPTYEDPAADAEEVQAALRALAHATRSIDDPRQVYTVLGSLTASVASLRQSLHQLAEVHDSPRSESGWTARSSRVTRSAVDQVSWELHRSAEILGQVLDSIGQAQSAEATITYERPNRSDLSTPRRSTVYRGLGL